VSKSDRDRDESAGRLMRDALEARTAARASDECLDAETVAAWFDDALSAHERAAVEAHAADCARCQALLAAVVRSTPPTVAQPWWRSSVIGWLVPVSLAAAALIVWVSGPRRTALVTAARPTALNKVAAAPAPQASANEQPQPVESSQSKTAMSSARQREIARGSAPTNAPRRSDAEQPRATLDKIAPSPPPTGALAERVIVTSEPPAPPGAAAAAPLPSTAVPQSAGSPPPIAPRPSAAESVAPPSVMETVTTNAMASRSAVRRDALQRTVIVSPNPRIRWLLAPGGAAGVVQRSTDGGLTWQTQSTGATVPLTAGASPSPSVCWLVGSRGVVVLSIDDGRRWQRLPFPEMIDLVSILATDDKTAAVTAVDGRIFRTADRGVSWLR